MRVLGFPIGDFVNRLEGHLSLGRDLLPIFRHCLAQALNNELDSGVSLRIHDSIITRARDICNPRAGLDLRQSNEMPKRSLKEALARNLKELRTKHEHLNTYKKVGDAAGIGHGTVERIEKMQSDAKLESVEALADTFGVDPTTLLSPNMKAPRTLSADVIEIPQHLEVSGSMGAGVVLRDQPGEIQGWRVTPDWVRKNIKNHSGLQNLCIVTGFGDSMKSLYNPGDPLIIDTGIKAVDWDAVYFFRVGNEGFIKRLQRIPGEGIRVISTNKEYESWTIKPDMDLEIFGQVLKAWCSTDF